uniref:UDP-glucuronosyltransferase n=1 Tax=Plectus sambesii TaxID=2011161 RepID=A0A914WEC8_9BILA
MNVHAIVLFCCLAASNAAKILLTTMPQGRSHAGTFMPLMHRLVEDGHEVTVFFEIFRPELPLGGGVKENLILIKGDDMSVDNDPVFTNLIWSGSMRGITIAIPFYQASKTCSALLENQPEDFYRLSNQTFDLFLTDSLFSPCGYALALLSKKPYVMMHSSDLEPVYSYLKGYGRNYGTVAPFSIAYEYPEFDVDKLYDRFGALVDFLETTFSAIVPANYFMQRAINPIVDNRYSLNTYVSQSSFSFYDMPESVAWPMPGANDLVSFGAHCKTAQPLKDEFERFVADAKSKGTILIAFGTICNWEFAPKRIVDAFVDALNRLSEYRIIWGYKGPKLDGLKSHVMVHPWIPQESILQDKRTKLFVSHGGLKSFKEAVCSETPVVYMPMFAEQLRNSWLARSLHFAEFLNKKNLTADYMEKQMRTILDDNSYQTSVSKLRQFYNDRPSKPLDAGSFWFRRLLKYGGRMPEYFYRVGAKLNSFVYFYMDALSLIAVSMYFVAS